MSAPDRSLRRPPTLIERLEYGAYRILTTIIWPLNLNQRRAFAAVIGRLIGVRLGFVKRADDALRIRRPALNADDRKAIIRQMMENFARTGVEYSRLPDMFATVGDWEIVGAEHLEAAKAIADGRMVVVSAHYANWEAVRAAGAHLGAPMTMVYRPFNNPLIDRDWRGFIESVGLPPIPKGRVGARALIRHVARRGAVLILVDQRIGGAPLIDFMGEPAETALGPAQLALRTKTPLLPAVAHRTETGFRVTFEPPIPPAEPEKMMAMVNRRIEAWIDEDPGQWFWFHRRWRIRDVSHGVRKRSRSQSDEDDVDADF